MRLTGKSILIVDGYGAFGGAAARAFAAEGARVAVGERRAGGAADLVAAIERDGGRARAVGLDPRDPASCEAAVQATDAAFGGLDVLCNTAIRSPEHKKLLHETSEAEWDEIIDAGVTAVALPTRFALRVMKAQGRGAIIAIGSSAALVGVPGVSAFSAAAGALTNWTRNIALEGSKHDIRANLLCLGSSWDPIVPSRIEEHAANPVPPEEIAPTLVFLAADESRHITGQVVAADDGMTAWRTG